MKKYYYLSIFLLLSTFGTSIFADEWLDIARDLQKQIVTQMPLSPEDQTRIDVNLAWANRCTKNQIICPTDNEKHSIREIVKQLETLWEKYQELGVKSPVLEYVIGKAEALRAMTQDDVSPMGPVVTDVLLRAYYQDAFQTYQTLHERDVMEKTLKHQNALNHLPEGTVIPNVPKSKTYQAIVIDISEQRIYAFEDEMLIYTNSITSGKNGFATIR